MHAFKHWSLFTLASALLSVPALARPQSAHDINIVKREISAFEKRYIDTFKYKHPSSTIKLIGLKKIVIPADQVETFEDHYYTNYDTLDEFGSHIYDPVDTTLRVYFPVRDALIEHDGNLIEANELGEFEVDGVIGDLAILGRKKTPEVHGSHGNIVKDGIIYLADKAYPSHSYGNIHVYDMGFKNLDHDHHSEHHSHDKREGITYAQGSCLANHGGINCSRAYNLYANRCPFREDTCMDYNGYFTDCQKAHKYLYFIGSDCSMAVARGHCWNEVEHVGTDKVTGG
jgi:hypothetical protein